MSVGDTASAASRGGDHRTLRAVALPSEHGGWSITAEPVLLGLLVAWSWAGAAIGAAAMAGFLARTPLKLVLVDRWRGRWLPRTRLAAIVAAGELALIAALAVVALAWGAAPFWPPLAVAAPLVLVELWYDMRSRGRRLVPELAGSTGIGAVAAAIALAGGSAGRVAWGLWAVVAIRSLAAIPYVRVQIMRAKDRPAQRWTGDIAQLGAMAAAVTAFGFDLVPGGSVVVLVALAAWHLTALRLRARPAVAIGIEQSLVGLAVIVVTAVAVRMA